MEPRIYVQCDDNGKVFAISEINCNLVEVPEYNDNLIGTTYNSETREFSGLRIALSTSKLNTVIGEKVQITATITNWDNSPCSYEGQVHFWIGDTRKSVEADNGVAMLSYEAEAKGTVLIRVDDEEFINAVSISIEAFESL